MGRNRAADLQDNLGMAEKYDQARIARPQTSVYKRRNSIALAGCKPSQLGVCQRLSPEVKQLSKRELCALLNLY
jgi:hypothetical protein